MPNIEKPLGVSIRGTTEAPAYGGLAGKSIALNLSKRSYFRFRDRDDFELTTNMPFNRLPMNLNIRQEQEIARMINMGEMVRGEKPVIIIKRQEDKIKHHILFIQQSRSFTSIKKRILDISVLGPNVAGSGYSARELLEMIVQSELETLARQDVLNFIGQTLENVAGNTKPFDEPGSQEVPRAISLGAADLPIEKKTAKPGSRSARETLAKEPTTANIAAL